MNTTDIIITQSKVTTSTKEQKQNLVSEVEELKTLFKLAEQRIKISENVDKEIAIPSVNQLRYAAHHFILCQNEHYEEQLSHLQKAKNHCKRAVYDAVSALALYYLNEVHNFQKDYKNVEVSPVIPEYLKVVKESRIVQNRTSKETSDIEKEKYYAEFADMVDQLGQKIHILEDSRDELNKRMRIDRRNVLFTITGIVIGIFGIIATIVLSS